MSGSNLILLALVVPLLGALGIAAASRIGANAITEQQAGSDSFNLQTRAVRSGDGYRIIANSGRDGVQDVPHFHLHILAGRRLGRMLPQV